MISFTNILSIYRKYQKLWDIIADIFLKLPSTSTFWKKILTMISHNFLNILYVEIWVKKIIISAYCCTLYCMVLIFLYQFGLILCSCCYSQCLCSHWIPGWSQTYLLLDNIISYKYVMTCVPNNCLTPQQNSGAGSVKVE